MTTTEKTRTTTEVANRFNELAANGQWNEIQNELFSENAESIEPTQAQGMRNATGLEDIRKKGEEFNSQVEEMHGGYSTAPVVGGNFFSVGMGMDVTLKGAGRVKMDEVAVYEVKNGEIVKEQFFY